MPDGYMMVMVYIDGSRNADYEEMADRLEALLKPKDIRYEVEETGTPWPYHDPKEVQDE